MPYGQRGWFEAGAITLYAAVANISEGGLFVRTHAPLALGTRAQVRFPIGASGEVEAVAEVVWESSGGGGPAGMGLCFVAMDEGGRAKLKAYLGEPADG